MNRGITLAAGLAFWALDVHAAAIAGRVVDENNAGVAEARITFQSVAAYSAISDPTGAFALNLPPGHYAVRAEREGFFPLRDFALEVTGDTHEIHLAISHVREQYASVDVHATSRAVDVDQTAAQKQLTGLELIDVPYPATRDLRSALPLMPGVIRDSAGALHFDGAAEGQTLYLLDGFNFSDPLTGGLSAKLSVESVRSIDWSSGRYSPEFGKGSGGAMAIRTDMGADEWRYSATNFLPGFDTRHGLHVGTWAPRFNLSGPVVAGRVWFSEHLDFQYTQPVVPGLPRGQDRTQIFEGSNLARVQANLTPSQIVFADVLIDYALAPRTGLDAVDPMSTTSDRRSRTWFASVKDQIYLRRGMLLEIGYAEDRNYLRVEPQGGAFYQITPFRRTGNYFADSAQRSRRAQALANLFLPAFEARGRHQLKTGIDVDRLNYWQNVERSGIDVFNLTGALVRQTTFSGSGILSQPGMQASWYVFDDWKIRPDVSIEYGIRQDWDELLHDTAWSPRVSAAWTPFGSKDTKISAGYAIVRDAAPLELFARARDQYAINTFVSGPTLLTLFEPAQSGLRYPRFENWTLGFERRLPRNLDVTLTALRKRGVNGLSYSPAETAGVYTLSNSRRDSYDSLEIAARQRFGEQYEWMASYTRSRAHSNTVIDPSIDQPIQFEDNTGPLNWDAPNRFLSWAYLPAKWRNWAVAYSLDWRTGFPYSQINDFGQVVGAVNAQRFPAFFSLNAHPEWKFNAFGRRWALRGGVNNITNHRNPTIAQTIPGLPVRFFGSEGRHFVFRIRWLGKAQ